MDTLPPGDCMRWIPGGTFRMGDDNAYLEEAPAHAVAVSSFWIDAYVVTNANFAAFVTATGYRTVAERPLDPTAYAYFYAVVTGFHRPGAPCGMGGKPYPGARPRPPPPAPHPSSFNHPALGIVPGASFCKEQNYG